MFMGVHKAKAVKEKIRRICEFGTAEQRESKKKGLQADLCLRESIRRKL